MDTSYVEYHKNGCIKIEGQFKKCDQKKRIRIRSNPGEVQNCIKDTLKSDSNKRHGLWIERYENGAIKSKCYYESGFKNGNSLFYERDGSLLSSHYHVFDKEISMHKFHKGGGLELSKVHFYNFSEGSSHKLKMTLLWEFYNDGILKIQRETQFLGDNIQKQSFKEYYINGVLKTETRFLNQKRDGVHREYHKNSNPKYEGAFKDGKPINQHYCFNLNGQKISTEYWYNGKLLGIEKNQ